MSQFRLLIGILIVFVVYFTPNFVDQDGKVSTFFYLFIMGSFLLQQVMKYHFLFLFYKTCVTIVFIFV